MTVIHGEDEPPSPLSDVLVTARNCAVRGGNVFAAAALAPVVVYIVTKVLTRPESLSASHLVVFIYVTFPLAAAIGGIVGYRLYRLAVSESITRVPGWQFVIAIFVVSWLTLPIYIACRLRYAAFDNERSSSTALPIYVGLALLSAVGAGLIPGTDSIAILSYGWLFMLFACDAGLVQYVFTMRNSGILAVPKTQKFQFSLGTMMSIVLATSTWVTGLVLLIRSQF